MLRESASFRGLTSLVELNYLKDSNAAAHSVDSDIFYSVIHVQLHA